MKQEVVDKIISLVLFLTAVIITLVYIRRIPLPFKIVIFGLDALIYYWFHTVWNIDKLISKDKKEDSNE